VIGAILLSVFYVNFKTGGVINGISAIIQVTYNLGIAIVWFAFIVAIIAFTIYKREILTEIGVRIAQWIWSFIRH
jgi:hypothetical protein